MEVLLGLMAALLILYIAIMVLEPIILFYIFLEAVWRVLLWPFLELLGRTITRCSRWVEDGIRPMLIFLYFFVAEALSRETDEQNYDHEEAEDELDEQHAHNNSYENALKLLGLQAGYTQEMPNRAFRRAMEMAHPDKGGTHEQALALNAARDILKTHNGWR